MHGIDVRPGSVDTGDVEDAAGFVAGIATIRAILPMAEQAHWDVRDAQAHALIALSMKRTITPQICLVKSTKHAWDILVGLYVSRG